MIDVLDSDLVAWSKFYLALLGTTTSSCGLIVFRYNVMLTAVLQRYFRMQQMDDYAAGTLCHADHNDRQSQAGRAVYLSTCREPRFENLAVVLTAITLQPNQIPNETNLSTCEVWAIALLNAAVRRFEEKRFVMAIEWLVAGIPY